MKTIPDLPNPALKKELRIKEKEKLIVRPLDPSRQYRQDLERVLRGLAKWIARFGFCPNAHSFARHQNWIPKVVIQYLKDLQQQGLAELFCGKVWNVTDEGYFLLGKVPMKPLLPPEKTITASSRAEAMKIARRLKDPEVLAAYEAFCREEKTDS